MKIQQYGDGRWGFDDYSSGKRHMVRLLSKEKAMARLKNGWKQADTIELKEFERWRQVRRTPGSLSNDGRQKRQGGMTESELLIWKHMSSWEDCEILKSGWPDFLVAHAGSIYCLEVKTGNQPLTDKQKKMHEILRKAGIKIFIVRDGWCEELQKRLAPSQCK